MRPNDTDGANDRQTLDYEQTETRMLQFLRVLVAYWTNGHRCRNGNGRFVTKWMSNFATWR